MRRACWPGFLPFAFLLLAAGSPPQQTQQVAPLPDYEQSLKAIAFDIEALKPRFPQLATFSARTAADASRLVIEYQFRTHPPSTRGGWTSGVPAPDDDGVWFYLDFHDKDSRSQIDTQPVYRGQKIGAEVVMLLILEGKKTNPLGEQLQKIMAAHGVTDGNP